MGQKMKKKAIKLEEKTKELNPVGGNKFNHLDWWSGHQDQG